METRDDIVEALFPIASGNYVPPPLTLTEAVFASEADSAIPFFTNVPASLHPRHTYSYCVLGDNLFAKGFIQYIQFRYPNSIGLTTYSDALATVPLIDTSRLLRITKLSQVRDSYPDGVNFVVQTSDVSKPDFAGLCQGGIYMLIGNLAEVRSIIVKIHTCFDIVSLFRPELSASVDEPVCIFCGMGFRNIPVPKYASDSLLPQSLRDQERIIVNQIRFQQETINNYKAHKLFDSRFFYQLASLNI